MIFEIDSLKDELFALAKNDSRIFEFIQESALEGLWYVNTSHPKNIWFNPKLRRVLDLDSDKHSLPLSFSKYIDENQLHDIIELFSANTTEKSSTEDITFSKLNGSQISYQCDIISVYDEAGKITSLIGGLRHALGGSDLKSLKIALLRYEQIIDGANIGSWEWNIQTGKVAFNEQWANTLGYTLEELEPISEDTWTRFAHPEDAVRCNALLNEHFEGKSESYQSEARMKHKDGSWVWVLDIGKVVTWTPDGKPEWMTGSHQSITTRKNNEILLTRYSDLLDKINEAAVIGTWDFDIINQEISWSKVTCDIHEVPAGYNPELENAIEFFPAGANRAKIEAAISRAIEHGENYDVEVQIKTYNNNLKWVRAVGIVEFENDKCVRLYGLFQDIDNIRKVFEKNRLFIEQAPSAIAMFDNEMRYLAASQKWLKDNKLEDKQINGKFHYELFPNISEEWKAIHQECLNGDIRKKDEDSFYNPQGELKWISWEVRPWYTEANTIGGILMYTQDISNLKEEERINAERQTLLQSILNSIDVGIISCNQLGEITLYNKASKDYIGLTGKTMSASQFSKHYGIYDSTGERLLSTEEIPLLKALRNEKVVNEEVLIKSKNGDTRIVSTTGGQLKSREGKIFGAVLAMHDITQKKIDDERLRISENTFRGNFENAAIGMAIVNNKGEWLKVNDTLSSIIGYTIDEFKQLTFVDITHPDDLEIDRPFIEELRNNQREYYHTEKRYFHKNGRTVHVILSVSLVRDTNDEPLYFIAQITDVTEQKIAEKSQRETLAKLEGLMEASYKVSVISTDVDGLITSFNIGAENLLGYSRDEVILKETPALFHSKEEVVLKGKELSKTFKKKIEGFDVFATLAEIGQSNSKNWTYIRKDGSSFPVHLTISPIKESDEIIGYLGVAVDISELKKVELEMKSLLEVSSDQNKRLKNFAHIVSHNLRSHSGNLAMLLDLYQMEQPDAGANEIFSHLITASKNLKDTITHLNEVVLINTSVSENLVPLNLFHSADLAIKNIAAIAQSAEVTINNQIDPSCEVLAISAYLDSIILNFLTNGIKYSSPERDSFINLKTKRTSKHIILTIEDNGLGINLKKNGAKLFGMYKTFHDHSDSRGIGLFITKNQIEALGGKIEVESEVNKGTSFKIYFKYEKN